jgi:pyruvate formate lyase activating enzyme
MKPEGYAFDVRRMQTHDGPGIRTTVFMKGCSLRCAWCHNPESLSPGPELWRLEERCIACGRCAEVCPEAAISDAEALRIDRERCTGCSVCVAECPAHALKALRTCWSVDALFAALERDRAFLEDGGGVTLSGGEPALQGSFVGALLERCRTTGLHTALDTCGAVGAEAYEALLPRCDLILFDVKIMDEDLHRKWTGQGNAGILGNLKRTVRRVREGSGLELWIRTPLIPGATAREDNIAAIADFLREEADGAVTRWELCAFNNLCVEKYRRLDRAWRFAQTPLLEQPTAGRLLDIARARSGLDSSRVLLKGLIR